MKKHRQWLVLLMGICSGLAQADVLAPNPTQSEVVESTPSAAESLIKPFEATFNLHLSGLDLGVVDYKLTPITLDDAALMKAAANLPQTLAASTCQYVQFELDSNLRLLIFTDKRQVISKVCLTEREGQIQAIPLSTDHKRQGTGKDFEALMTLNELATQYDFIMGEKTRQLDIMPRLFDVLTVQLQLHLDIRHKHEQNIQDLPDDFFSYSIIEEKGPKQFDFEYGGLGTAEIRIDPQDNGQDPEWVKALVSEEGIKEERLERSARKSGRGKKRSKDQTYVQFEAAHLEVKRKKNQVIKMYFGKAIDFIPAKLVLEKKGKEQFRAELVHFAWIDDANANSNRPKAIAQHEAIK